MAEKAIRTIGSLFSKRWKQQDNRPVYQGANPWIRASTLAQACLRYEVLRYQWNVNVQKDPASEVAFALGTGIHHVMQNGVLVPWLRGCWVSRSGEVVGGYTPEERNTLFYSYTEANPPKEVVATAQKAHQSVLTRLAGKPASAINDRTPVPWDNEEWAYQELWFGDHELRVGGHPDGFLYLDEAWPSLDRAGLGVVEVKSISAYNAKGVIVAPLPHHVVQIQTYLWLTGLQWGVILYVDKGAQGMAVFRDHFVMYDPVIIDQIRRNAASLRLAISGGPLPAGQCPHVNSPAAEKCCVRVQCFPEEVAL